MSKLKQQLFYLLSFFDCFDITKSTTTIDAILLNHTQTEMTTKMELGTGLAFTLHAEYLMTMISLVFGLPKRMINTQVLKVADCADLQLQFRLWHGGAEGMLNFFAFPL